MEIPSAGTGISDFQHLRSERLESWKEIASFFRREVRTVQLWEKHEGLPVRRQQHRKLGSVYAYRAELERWWIARSAIGAGRNQAVVRPNGGNGSEGQSGPGSAPAAPQQVCAWQPPKPSHPSAHLVVLPFITLHATFDRTPFRHTVETFCAALNKDLVVELGRQRLTPTVLPAKAVPSGEPTLTLMKRVAHEFSAELVLTGAVCAVDAQVRVSAQLIRAADLRCLWSERFDAASGELLEAQIQIAGRIARALADKELLAGAPPKASATERQGLAHHAYLIGVHYWNQRSTSALQKSLGYFRDAVELEPRYADAYAGLANAYVSLSYNHMMPAREAATLATQAAQNAFRLDRNSVQARNAIINVLTNCSWHWGAAERECRDALDSGILDSRTIQLYSCLLNSQGRHEEAITLALRAHRLDPLSAASHTQVALAYFYGGDYDNAVPYVSRALEVAPHFTMGHAMLGRIQAQRGKWDESLNAFQRTQEMSNNASFSKALVAYAHAGRGDISTSTRILDLLNQEKADSNFPAYDVSAAQAALNRESEALENIYRAYEGRDMKTIFVNHDPRFARLRNSPGFHPIASAMTCN